MLVTVLVYVEEHKRPGRSAEFRARPLFADGPWQSGAELSRVLSRLARALRKTLAELGRDPDHSRLAALVRAPELTERTLELTLHLRRRTLRTRFLWLVEKALDRRVAYSPSLPNLRVVVERGASLRARVSEELTRAFKEVERAEDLPAGEDVGLRGQAWLTSLDFEVSRGQQLFAAPASKRASLWGDERPLDGAAELQRVGRCLDWRYPHDLQRALLREDEARELVRLLGDPRPRRVLIVGPPGVGKTCLVHEVVHRRVAARSSPHTTRGATWQLAPQRLISGMSMVGQWQKRVLAILAHARKRSLVLYVDDVLGLYDAGRSAGSSLTVADLLREQLARNPVCLVGELTPDELRVFQELDRGFADTFQILRLEEPSLPDAQRILLRQQRRLEDQQGCRFALDALPTALDVTQSYLRERALPGKTAAFMERLAVRGRERWIQRDDVLKGFHELTGLSLALLDHRQRLLRSEVLEGLAARVVGQRGALEALTDVVLVSKARLNDPGRPLGAFLFLGPTGVGKTETAKALAHVLFSDEERLLRFDMNEYVEPGSATRLVGTFADPEGALVSALRQQPFCVLLLDEIEKADPSVFDLLLQALGEGRLTDARGRTCDLSNAIVILTSNLGARAAEASLGFVEEPGAREAIYRQEAERFFRPEFFNRLDRLIPFARLTREEIAQVAQRQVHSIFGREGFARRKVLLELHASAMERIVELGYHPELGARALKRALEDQVIRRAAPDLAALPPELPVLLSLYAGADRLALQVQELRYAPRRAQAEAWTPRLTLEAVAERVSAWRSSADADHPTGALDPDALSPRVRRVFALGEQAYQLEQAASELREVLDEQDADRFSGHLPRTRGGSVRRTTPPVRWKTREPTQHELHAAADLRDFVRELAQSAIPLHFDADERARVLREELGLFELLARHAESERVLLVAVLRQPECRPWAKHLIDRLAEAIQTLPGFALTRLAPNALTVQGPGAERLLAGEVGTHLWCPRGRALLAVQALALPLGAEEDAAARLAALEAQRAGWVDSLATDERALAADPFPLGPVLRVYEPEGPTLDLASGQTEPRPADVAAFRRYLLARLAGGAS